MHVEYTDDRFVATVELEAPPERVFQAVASRDIVEWWVRPGVFDTREWSGEVQVGGRWRASGMGRGGPYVLDGEFLEVDPPGTLAHTWEGVGPPSTVRYLLEPLPDGGTRLTLRHEGFASREACAGTGAGWETSLDALAGLLTTGSRT
jgi:uncharacterized protein YndB with AHSA1/START domain